MTSTEARGQSAFEDTLDEEKARSPSFRVVTNLFTHGLRRAGVATILLQLCWSVGLAVVAFYIAYDGEVARGFVAALLTGGAATFCVVPIGLYYGAVSLARKAIEDAGLGKVVLDELFDKALGTTNGNTSDGRELPLESARIAKQELEAKLKSAATALLAGSLFKSIVRGPLYWIAKKAQSICIWATVKLACKLGSDSGDSIDMLELRDRVSSKIDENISSYLGDTFRNLAMLVVILVSSIALVIAYGIRQVSFPLGDIL